MLEAQQVQCEEDKVTKDNQIRTLKDEMMHQVWLILGNCDKFYFTSKFKVRMWVRIFQKFENDWIIIHNLSN
jgi:hypothetical protein